MEEGLSRKLAVLLHADVVGSTALVQSNEILAHQRIQDTFRRFSETIVSHGGTAHEIRGDAIVAEFTKASDAVSASLAFQEANRAHNDDLPDEICPIVRVGIALGEVVVANNTVTGEGIVLAQRLEQLAEPGGVCIQDAAYQTVPKRLPFKYASLGERELKGFNERVRAYSVSLRDDSATSKSEAPSADVGRPAAQSWSRYLLGLMVAAVIVAGGSLAWWQPWQPKTALAYPLPDKPSIAILPFDNLSDDPSQEYFVDGMTEDLITDLAKIESLFVIARNTVFTYKGRSVIVPDVARELGVKYVLEGSVRRVGDRVRINTQLIDGTSGEHVWAERYDGSLTDIFSLQDEVTGEIIGQLKIRLSPDEQVRRAHKGTDNPEAHDAYLKGWQLYRRYTPEDFVEAIPYLERATELDPDYGQAWAALASIYWITYRKYFGWSLIVNPDRNNVVSWIGTFHKTQHNLRQAMRNPTPLAYQIESQISSDYRQFDKALSEAEQAVTLDPNDPEGHQAMAWALIFAGRAEEAIASAENGVRLDPHYPAPHLAVLGMAHLMLQQYTEAEAALKRALGLNPENKTLLLPLAAAYGHLDNQQEGQATLKEYDEFLTLWTPKIETYMTWWPFKREVDMRLFTSGLVKAGLCCEEESEAYIDRLRQGGTLE
jgi:adenylate cyclase